ncbi:MAG: hemolysin III family protein, partial [Candidatus Thermoplasmatota archaeon]|nr:hemolysin III family protein [Candidatus Thermoplasmatota archaeon]
MLSKMREPTNGLTHFFAGIVAIGGLAALLFVGRGDAGKQLSLLVYGSSLLLMFFASSAYHLIQARPERILALRKLDHAAIYILIAGTYTPICFNQFTGFWRWGVLAIVWSLAVAGIITKMLIINPPRWLSAGVYLVMGWLSLLAMREMLRALPVGALVWLLVGGVFFTIGAVVYITKIMDFAPGAFGFHEVWHI